MPHAAKKKKEKEKKVQVFLHGVCQLVAVTEIMCRCVNYF
jgi:hypothetical protein